MSTPMKLLAAGLATLWITANAAPNTPPPDRVKCDGLYLTSMQCEDAKRTGTLKKSTEAVSGDKFRCEELFLNKKECENAKKGIDIKDGRGVR